MTTTTNKVTCPSTTNSWGDHWIQLGESCYLYEHEFKSQAEAKYYCQSQGGYVVELNTPEESDIIYANQDLLGIHWFWLGLNRISDDWVWISGDPLDWTNWADGYPKHDADCANVGRDPFEWYDLSCSSTNCVLCEA